MGNPFYYYNNFPKLVNTFVNWLLKILAGFGKYVQSLFDNFIKFIASIGPRINDFIKKALASLLDLVKQIGERLNQTLTKIQAYMFKLFVEYPMKLLVWMGTGAFIYITYFIGAIFQLGFTILADFGEQALKMFAGIPGTIVDSVFSFIPEPVKGTVVGPLKSGLEALFSGKTPKISIDISKLLGDLTKQAEDAAKAVANEAKKGVEAVGKAFGF